jgi:hypothetical protein
MKQTLLALCFLILPALSSAGTPSIRSVDWIAPFTKKPAGSFEQQRAADAKSDDWTCMQGAECEVCSLAADAPHAVNVIKDLAQAWEQTYYQGKSFYVVTDLKVTTIPEAAAQYTVQACATFTGNDKKNK